MCTRGVHRVLPPLEILPERLIDDLGNGQVVEVCLSSDGLNPAAFDMEGDTLGLLGGIAGLCEGGLTGKVYPLSDLARRANERALRKNSPVESFLEIIGKDSTVDEYGRNMKISSGGTGFDLGFHLHDALSLRLSGSGIRDKQPGFDLGSDLHDALSLLVDSVCTLGRPVFLDMPKPGATLGVILNQATQYWHTGSTPKRAISVCP